MIDYKISVSICVYDGDNPKYFDTALESIFTQTRMPDEVVLVVDGPINDDIKEVIEKYRIQYDIFKVITLSENAGHGNARRLGLKNCKHRFVAIMDADDICVKDRFEKQINVFKKDSSISAVGGLISEFVESENKIIGIRTVPEFDNDIKKYMKKRCPMNQVTVMFNKDDVESVGGYIDWYCEEDYYLWLRLALNGKKFYNIQENLVYVRVGDEMYQRRGGLKYFRSEAKLQKYMLDNGVIGILRYFINVIERFIVQVLIPNKMRGIVFKILARE